ncbi:MAG: FAD:protein FMN transferase [Deltaproteobacteria bacterium]|nr:FAD:protein FMN transferase [Deltaproteobacteria bacterium]
MKDMDLMFHRLDRRSFLKLSGLLGMSAAATTLIPSAAEAVRFNKQTMMVSERRLIMGTYVSMTLFHPVKDQAEEAMEQAFQEIDRLAGILTRYDRSSAVAFLNKEGYARDLPPEVIRVVSRALHYHKLTYGAFDITVKPVVDLFRQKLGGDKKDRPTEQELKALLKLVDAGKVGLHDRSIRFVESGMGITLDGIAKGFIVDQASELLASRGVENHLIDAGGDIRTRGKKEGEKPWTVAVQDPLKRSQYPDMVQMKDGAIATSGNYEIYFDREKMFHHIVNPKTGLSPHLASSVSVTARTAMEADALSTGVFVMGPGEGTEFINGLPSCECLVISRNGSQSKSRGWKSAAI